ncbi:hypothetical protein ACWIJ6_10705 [Aeromonas piscicola]
MAAVLGAGRERLQAARGAGLGGRELGQHALDVGLQAGCTGWPVQRPL